jgi:molybdopterin converting factor small subunit
VPDVQLKVRLFGELAGLAGRSEVTVELAGECSLREALSAVDRQTRNPVKESVLFDDNTIFPSVAVLVNGKNVLLGAGLETRLGEGDTLAMMPLMGGGS